MLLKDLYTLHQLVCSSQVESEARTLMETGGSRVPEGPPPLQLPPVNESTIWIRWLHDVRIQVSEWRARSVVKSSKELGAGYRIVSLATAELAALRTQIKIAGYLPVIDTKKQQMYQMEGADKEISEEYLMAYNARPCSIFSICLNKMTEERKKLQRPPTGFGLGGTSEEVPEDGVLLPPLRPVRAPAAVAAASSSDAPLSLPPVDAISTLVPNSASQDALKTYLKLWRTLGFYRRPPRNILELRDFSYVLLTNYFLTYLEREGRLLCSWLVQQAVTRKKFRTFHELLAYLDVMITIVNTYCLNGLVPDAIWGCMLGGPIPDSLLHLWEQHRGVNVKLYRPLRRMVEEYARTPETNSLIHTSGPVSHRLMKDLTEMATHITGVPSQSQNVLFLGPAHVPPRGHSRSPAPTRPKKQGNQGGSGSPGGRSDGGYREPVNGKRFCQNRMVILMLSQFSAEQCRRLCRGRLKNSSKRSRHIMKTILL
uniref:Uncharacterized protein n=1 Tax=Chromera velia CCMP2878 TaxID=1169474 RepID=A0A0G4F0E7_9ALVE|eukprot:Cvel_2591.t1-p1 / transcript=Cvel_2591.t1 / gene=Cvel_2591 / organism=Chromera_velia_CCMP2878 / gene_product=hypothetical protein / transcript_product=hypothetical protein / location=Cvel_scaffold102:107779-110624(+) / protein_length=482 / sequence_SO=supercontig / SO=protein_coding / is_pseudo=false